MAVQLPVVLALLTMAVHTPVSEGIFTLPPLPSRSPGTLPPLRCDSVLVQNNPDNYPHCWCSYGQWTDWKYITTTANTTCPSNQSHTLKRTRSSLSFRCNIPTQSEMKYICEPTPESKVNKLAAVLFLGPAVEEPTTAPPASGPHTSTTTRPHTSASSTPRTRAPSTPRTTAPSTTQSTLEPYSSGSGDLPILPIHKRDVTHTCPESVEQKDICRSITEPCKQTKRYPSIAKRSTVDYTESDRVRLATLIMQQDELYKPRSDRVKRELPPANRSVLFVLDSSGSISRDEFKKVTSFLAEIALHLCGEVAVGMLTYSTHIRLHFCPTCLRDDDITEAKYRKNVAKWIRGVQYHGHYTLTGEVLKCLTNDIMTDPGCVFAQTKPTHIVFFTDGVDNGCQNVNRAAKELVSEHTNTEIYAIGIGNIRTSGVADLQTDPDSQTIFFNFNTLAELVSTWEVFKTHFLKTGASRGLPVDFGTRTRKRFDCST